MEVNNSGISRNCSRSYESVDNEQAELNLVTQVWGGCHPYKPHESSEVGDEEYLVKLIEFEKSIPKAPNPKNKGVRELVISIVERDVIASKSIIRTMDEPISEENQKFLISQIHVNKLFAIENLLLDQFTLFPPSKNVTDPTNKTLEFLLREEELKQAKLRCLGALEDASDLDELKDMLLKGREF